VGATEKCTEELTSAIQEATTASAPRRRNHSDPRPSIAVSIKLEEPAEEAVANHEGPRSVSPDQPPPEVDDLSAE
jgi:hypothetical protein